MYIKELILTNYRSYQEQKLQFEPGINLLIGSNNSGKSSIIRAIYRLQRDGFIRKDDIRQKCDELQIEIKIGNFNSEDVEYFYDKDRFDIKKNDKDKTVLFRIYRKESILDESFFYDSEYTLIRKDGNTRAISKTGEFGDFLNFKTFSDKENQNNFIYPFFSKRKLPYQSSHRGTLHETFTVQPDFGNLASKISKLLNNPKSDDFKKYCEEIIGFRISVIPGESESSGERIGMYTDSNSYIPIESMGDGVINLVGMIVLLLTEDRKLFLVEELENDIHPKALKKILELIIEKKENNQFIISTHSNIILKKLGGLGSKIHYLTWSPLINKKFGNLIIPSTTVKAIENTPQEKLKILEELGYEFIDYDLYKLFIIFEESSAEQLVKDFIIPYFVPELYGNVKTIAANGADDLAPKFNDLHRMFLYTHSNPVYYLKSWVLADGDLAGLKNIKDLKAKFRSWPPSHFINFSKPNIEDYYPKRFSKKVKSCFLIKDPKERFEAKSELTKYVMKWIFNNIEKAKIEFSSSSMEIINIIRNINQNAN